MRRQVRWIGVAGALAVAGFGLWVAPRLNATQETGRNAGSPGQPATVQSVEVVKPQRLMMSRKLDVPARLEAFEVADLHAKISGYISEVRADIGDHVKSGEILAVMSVPEMEKQLLEAKAERAAKEAVLAAAESSDLEAARAHLDEAQRKLDEARRDAARREVEASFQQTLFERRQGLFSDKAITQEQLEEARNALDVARADLDVARAKIAVAQSEVTSAHAAEAVAMSHVEVAKAQAAFAVAKVETIATMMQYATITAPFDGVITKRGIDRGDLATANRTEPLFTVHSVDRMRVFFEAPESDVPRVKAGCHGQVKPYALPGESVEGTVARTAAAVNPSTGTMRAELDLPNPDGQLLHGMYVQVVLDVEERENALTIPAAALLTEGSQKYVYVAQNDQATRKQITTGLDDGILIEVLDGLSDDDWVVLTGKNLVSPGARIRAVPREGDKKPSVSH
jgi:RND family efflux transporter MFP subunit